MIEENLGVLYEKIAQTIVDTIPEEWLKVYLYGELTDDVRKSFFFYCPTEGSPVYSHDIPEVFNIERAEYKRLWRQLLNDLQELWHEFKNNGHEPWTSLTLIFDHSGDFKIEYNYEDLSEANDNERQIIWEHKYLGLIPKDEDDKRFLDAFLNQPKIN